MKWFIYPSQNRYMKTSTKLSIELNIYDSCLYYHVGAKWNSDETNRYEYENVATFFRWHSYISNGKKEWNSLYDSCSNTWSISTSLTRHFRWIVFHCFCGSWCFVRKCWMTCPDWHQQTETIIGTLGYSR